MTSAKHAGTKKVPAFYLDAKQLACAVLAAALIVLAYPKAGLSGLGWLALAPLIYGLARCRSGFNASAYGWAAGFLFYCGLLYWLVPTCVAGGLNAALAVMGLAALAALLAVEWAAFAACAFYFRGAGVFLFPLAAALCWVGMEWSKQLLAQYVVWFPWFMLGYTQYKNPAVIQTASVCGVYGVSFVLAYAGFSAGSAALNFKASARFKSAFVLIPALALAFAAVGYGRVRLTLAAPLGSSAAELCSAPWCETPHYSVAILQPNIEQYRKWDAQFEDYICTRLKAQAELVTRSAPKNTAFALWPESALPGYIETAKYGGLVSSAARASGLPQVLGAPSMSREKRVSAFLFDSSGTITGVYDKRKLVPFGEYVPLRAVLGGYIGVINQLGEFDPGDKNQPLLQAGDVSIGAGICYEAIFPYLWRERAAKGANIFASMTNDGWYLNTAAPYQHFAANVFRAVENGVPLVRAANTGISGGIDRWGRITAVSKLDTDTVMFIPVLSARRTVYSKAGDWFPALCMLVLGGLAVYLRRRK